MREIVTYTAFSAILKELQTPALVRLSEITLEMCKDRILAKTIQEGDRSSVASLGLNPQLLLLLNSGAYRCLSCAGV